MVDVDSLQLGDYVAWDPFREGDPGPYSGYANEPSVWRVIGLGFEALEGYRLGIGAKDAINLERVQGKFKPMLKQGYDPYLDRSPQVGFSRNPMRGYERQFWYKEEPCPRCGEGYPPDGDYICCR